MPDQDSTAPEASGRKWPPATITLTLEPEGRTESIPRPKTVKQLLDRLGRLEETALVIRDGGLLTPDRQIFANDSIIVRSVISTG